MNISGFGATEVADGDQKPTYPKPLLNFDKFSNFKMEIRPGSSKFQSTETKKGCILQSYEKSHKK